MKDSIKMFTSFFLGAAAGVTIGVYFARKKYSVIAQEEIASVKAAFAKRSEKQVEDQLGKVLKKTVQAFSDYAGKIQENGYIAEESSKTEEPYVISPEEFGEFEEYSRSSLTFLADGVLVDENLDILDNMEDTVGLDWMNHFGEYEDDAVHIRNDRRKSDYEILLDNRRYEDILRMMPPQPMVM